LPPLVGSRRQRRLGRRPASGPGRGRHVVNARTIPRNSTSGTPRTCPLCRVSLHRGLPVQRRDLPDPGRGRAAVPPVVAVGEDRQGRPVDRQLARRRGAEADAQL